MRGSRKFIQRGYNFLFLVDEGSQAPLKAGKDRPASETPFKMRIAGVPMTAQLLNAGLVALCFFRIWTSIAKKLFIL